MSSILFPNDLQPYSQALMKQALLGICIIFFILIVVVQLATCAFGSIHFAVAIISFESIALLSPATSKIAADENLTIEEKVSTILFLNASEALIAGVLLLILGYCKLGSLIHYMPYSVKQGAFGAIGYFLYLFSYNIQYDEDISTKVFTDHNIAFIFIMHVLLLYLFRLLD